MEKIYCNGIRTYPKHNLKVYLFSNHSFWMDLPSHLPISSFLTPFLLYMQDEGYTALLYVKPDDALLQKASILPHVEILDCHLNYGIHLYCDDCNEDREMELNYNEELKSTTLSCNHCLTEVLTMKGNVRSIKVSYDE